MFKKLAPAMNELGIAYESLGPKIRKQICTPCKLCEHFHLLHYIVPLFAQACCKVLCILCEREQRSSVQAGR